MFIETIRLVDGKAQLLDYHQERMERSLRALSSSLSISLPMYVQNLIERTERPLEGIYKLRFEYDTRGLYAGSITPYTPKQIDRLVPWEVDCLDFYEYKYRDRSRLNVHAEMKLTPNEEVVFTCQGMLSDTSYSNILLDMGDGQWLTPEQPLLRGVMRQYLLDTKQISEAPLDIEDLAHCCRFRLINAMLPLSR